MAIHLYCGTVGGGKSFSAVRQMLECLAAGRSVASNIRLNWEEVEKYCQAYWCVTPARELYTHLSDDSMVFEANKYIAPGREGAESLLVIDECNIFFPARGWKANSEKAQTFLDWVVQSRKFGVECIFIIQHPKNLDVTIARQAATEWRFQDWRKVKLPIFSSFAPWFKWPWHQISASCWDLGGDLAKPVMVQTYKADRRIYACYSTLEVSRAFQMATPMTDAALVKDRAKLSGQRRKLAVAALALIVAAGAGCARSEKTRLAEAEKRCLALEKRLSVALVAVTSMPARVVQVVGAAAVATNAAAAVAPAYARSAVVLGWSEGPASVYCVDQICLRPGDYWQELGGMLETVMGNYALVRDAQGLRCVSLLKKTVIETGTELDVVGQPAAVAFSVKR